MILNSKLAIVIPYFKNIFFEDLLKSLSNQTNLNFNIYIGDDNSPESPREIIEKYENKLSIKYHKYENNLGHTSLVKHWNRCLMMLNNEEWVWILPDDDMISENCVEDFYRALTYCKEKDINVFRIPSVMIDKDGVKINQGQPSNPEYEDNLEFYTRLLRRETSATLGDNIFNRKKLEDNLGFVEFPKAWGSDHATILKIASNGVVYYLPNSIFYFRDSGKNISSQKIDGSTKMRANLLFIQWIIQNESIFPKKPNNEFYKFYYWQMEYPIIHFWNFDFINFKYLYKIRQVCFNSDSTLRNILYVLIILIRKVNFIIRRVSIRLLSNDS